jgi:hypothetical protein
LTARDPEEELGILKPNQIPVSTPQLSTPPGLPARAQEPPNPSKPTVKPTVRIQPPSATTPGFITAHQTIRQHEQCVHLAVIKKLRTSFDLASVNLFEQSFDLCEQAFFISTRFIKDPNANSKKKRSN